ncbi:hypothetical protein CRYUN_Cryun06bG0086500 [Craigia yunnanensis]
MKTLGGEDEDKSEVNGAIILGLSSFIKDNEVNAEVSTQVSFGSDEEKVDFLKDYPCLKESFEMGRQGHKGFF